MRRLVLNIPDGLYRRLKVVCTLQGRTMTEASLQLLAEYVKKEEKRKFILFPQK